MASPSNVAHPAMLKVLVEYDDDARGAAEALLALLRKPTPPAADPAPAPQPDADEAA